MALEIKGLKRVFKLKKNGETLRLDDPNPEMAVNDVMDFYSMTYTELTTATPHGPVMEDDCEQRADAVRLRRMVEALPPRECRLLTLRYGLGGRPPQTQQEVAQQLGISRSYVSRIEKRALDRLQKAWRGTPFR